MAINVFKSGGIGRYYFKENNIEYGPFQLEWILQFIDADTQVKVSNSNWCPAKQHPDFSKFFVSENISNNQVFENQIAPVIEKKGNSYLGLLSAILLLGFLFIGYQYLSNNSKAKELEITKEKQEAIDSINTVNLDKENLLLRQQDSLNTISSKKTDSIKNNEKKIYFLQNEDLLSDKISSFYADLSADNFDAFNYFSDVVYHYITLSNVSPDQINSLRANKKDYTNENATFDSSSFRFSHDLDNIFYYEYSINYSCYRTRRNSTQNCDVDIEVGFDENFKIVSYRELQVRNLTFD
jgi:hypothetical protein